MSEALRAPLRLMLLATGSTDRLAAVVLQHIAHCSHGQVEAFGLGGPGMAQQGFESLVPADAARGMSSAEMLPRLPFFSKLLHENDPHPVPSMMEYIQHLTKAITAAISERKPDAIVCVGSHFLSTQFLAGYKTAAKSYKIKAPPRIQLMAPAAGDFRVRSKALKMWRQMYQVDYMLCCQPHEPPLLRAHGLSATFVGHPVINSLVEQGAAVQEDGSLLLPLQLQDAADAFRAAVGLPHQRVLDAPLVWLAPGEAEAEVVKCMPLFDAVMRQVRGRFPGAQCVVAVPHFWSNQALDALRNFCCPARLVPLDSEPWPSLLAADVALTCAGNATTVAAAAAQTPLVVATPAHWFSDSLAYQASSSKAAASPNLVLGPGSVPEVVAWKESAAEELARAVCHLLADQGARAEQVATLRRFQAALLPAPPMPGHTPLLAAEASALAILDIIEQSHRDRPPGAQDPS